LRRLCSIGLADVACKQREIELNRAGAFTALRAHVDGPSSKACFAGPVDAPKLAAVEEICRAQLAKDFKVGSLFLGLLGLRLWLPTTNLARHISLNGRKG
jgi:hypothetical protein